MTLSELTAKFWAAAKYSRIHSDQDQKPAQQLLRTVAEYSTGTLQQRAKELLEDDDNGPGTSYTG